MKRVFIDLREFISSTQSSGRGSSAVDALLFNCPSDSCGKDGWKEQGNCKGM